MLVFLNCGQKLIIGQTEPKAHDGSRRGKTWKSCDHSLRSPVTSAIAGIAPDRGGAIYPIPVS